jgi:hypothetical protein
MFYCRMWRYSAYRVEQKHLEKATMDWACGYNGISDAHMLARIHPHTYTDTVTQMHTHANDYTHKKLGLTTLEKSS